MEQIEIRYQDGWFNPTISKITKCEGRRWTFRPDSCFSLQVKYSGVIYFSPQTHFSRKEQDPYVKPVSLCIIS